ncbi:MAG: hypothetical protein AAGJ38_10080 [Planctomycetota bacterium]
MTDTSPEAQAVLTNIYRKMTPEQKIHRVAELSQRARNLALSRIRAAHPDFTEQQVIAQLVEELYGIKLPIRSNTY